MAPEIRRGCLYGPVVDWWTVGCVMYEGKSLHKRNAILKCMKKYAQRKILFQNTKCLLSNISYRSRDNQAV